MTIVFEFFLSDYNRYSPIGRGMLTGQIKSFNDFPENDFRRHTPRFQPENFEINIKLVQELEKIAARRNCTPAQLALGWLVSLSKKEGMTAVELNEEDLKAIDSVLAKFEVVGDRYPAPAMKYVNG